MSILSLNDFPVPDDRLSPEPVTTAPCVQCGASAPKASKFCPECGASTSTACSHCGVAIPTKAKFCLECGASQSPQQDAPVASDSSKPFAQPNGTEAEPDGGRLPTSADAKEEDRPIFAWASSSVAEDSEPEPSSGLLKLVLICGALVLAIVLAGALLLGQRDTGIAHFKRGEELKNAGDYRGAKQELELCLSECKGWEKNTAREELERIEPLIAAQGQPQPSAEETERQQAVMGTPIDYMSFYAKSHTGLPVGQRYSFCAVLNHDLCISSDSQFNDNLCGTRADFDNQAEYESLLRRTDKASGTIVASVGADGTINIHSFHSSTCFIEPH